MPKSVYNDRFYSGQMHGSRRSAQEAVGLVLSLTEARSVIDVGCGMGAWLSACLESGVEEITGLDGGYVDINKLLIPRERFIPSDLARGMSHRGRYDLVISLEVAEHLPASRAAGFVQDLVELGPVILFSAAIPGQGGTHHVNEQWPEYWRDLFARHDYVLIDCLRRRLWNNERVDICYRQNMMFYVRRCHLANVPGLAREQGCSGLAPLSIVHPQLFQDCLTRPMTLRRLIPALPKAISNFIKFRMGIRPSASESATVSRWRHVRDLNP